MDGVGVAQTLSLSGDDLTITDGNTISLGSLGFWSLLGNSILNSDNYFLGTINEQDLVFRTDNTERMRILGTSGYVGIWNANPTHTLTTNGTFKANDGANGFESSNDLL